VTTDAFQRARRPEQKEQRRATILDAATDLARERPTREVSLGDLARRVDLAKSNVLRYFESREAVFLELLSTQWSEWSADTAQQMGSIELNAADAVAGLLARSLAERPLFCDLLSQMSAVLECNVSTATVYAFKTRNLDYLLAVGRPIADRLEHIDVEDGRRIATDALIITAGHWPNANPPDHVRDALFQMDGLAPEDLDFETGLADMLACLIVGLQTRNARRATSSRE
jgi:AcrR family transcriptional regulator